MYYATWANTHTHTHTHIYIYIFTNPSTCAGLFLKQSLRVFVSHPAHVEGFINK